MKRLNKLVLYISLLILVINFTIGCGIGKEAEVKKSFEKTLSIYPTKNLGDLYDEEGYRDDEFDKNDKGAWIVGSEMVVQPKGERMESEGMVLCTNRNTKTTTGKYIVSETLHDEDGGPKSKDREYPVKMVSNKIIPTKGIKGENIKKEIKNFKFFT